MATAISQARAGGERAAPDQLGQILAFDVLHRDVKIIVDVAGLVDAHHARVDGGQPFLQGGAAAFGFDAVDRIRDRARAR